MPFATFATLILIVIAAAGLSLLAMYVLGAPMGMIALLACAGALALRIRWRG